MSVQPRLHENAQPLTPKGEPSLALGAKRHEHVLEPSEGALAVDGDGELGAQFDVVDHRDVALHPAVLLARAHGIDAKVGGVGGDARMHLRIGDPIDDAKHFSRLQMQVTMDFRRIVLEGVLERLPIHGYAAQRGAADSVVFCHGSSFPRRSGGVG